MGKTGSSALQVALARNRGRLASLGVRYPEHDSDDRALAGGVVSGNGIALLPYLAPRPTSTNLDAEQALAMLWAELEAGDTVLYSSELLYQYRPDRLDELRESLYAEGVALQAVVYVRNIAGHAVSSYSQIVKRRLFTGTLTDYLTPDGGYGLSLRPRLEPLVETLGRPAVTVLHYDTERAQLVERFLSRVLGVNPAEFDLAHGTVNRSLTRREMALMRYLNTHLRGKVEAHRASDALIARPPLGAGRLALGLGDLATLVERYAAEVDWVNRVFFGEQRLSLAGGTEITEQGPVALDADALAIAEELLAVARIGRSHSRPWWPTTTSRPPSTTDA